MTSFAGFFPDDHPKSAGIVVVDDTSVTQDKNTGGEVAAPIFAGIALEATEHLKAQGKREK